MTARVTFSGGVILEKLYLPAAFGAFYIEYRPRFPVTTVLSGTLHD
jgi:hypothetical protein